MKNTNKKGFTIVELVIVIAVIAILAAVLIPTFTSIVNKANESADIQAARQLNTLLSTFVGDEKPEDISELFACLDRDDIDLNNYKPMAKGAKYYWVKSLNCIVYVNAAGEVVFPKGIDAIAEDDRFELSVAITSNEDFQNAIAQGGIVSVDGSMTVDTKTLIAGTTYAGVSLNPTKDVVINGGDLDVSYDATGVDWGYAFNIYAFEGVDVTVNDTNVSMGNISAGGTSQQYAFHSRVKPGNTLTLNNVSVDNSGGVAVAFFGERDGFTAGSVVLNNVTAIQSGGNSYATTALATGQGITVEVNGGKYQGAGYALYMYNSYSYVTVNDGEFVGKIRIDSTKTDGDFTGKIPAGAMNTLTINGGVFTGTFDVKTGNTKVIINGGTFSVDPRTITNVVINGTVTEANGVYTVG